MQCLFSQQVFIYFIVGIRSGRRTGRLIRRFTFHDSCRLLYTNSLVNYQTTLATIELIIQNKICFNFTFRILELLCANKKCFKCFYDLYLLMIVALFQFDFCIVVITGSKRQVSQWLYKKKVCFCTRFFMFNLLFYFYNKTGK